MTKCTRCNKNSNRTRIVTDGVCNECNSPIDVSYEDAPCDPDDKVGDIKVKDFVEWICTVLVKCVKEPLSIQIAECSKELNKTKEEVKTLKASLAKANGEIKPFSRTRSKPSKMVVKTKPKLLATIVVT